MDLSPLFQKSGLPTSLLTEYRGLFSEAMTHRSVPSSARPGRLHNERLEFLGDAVLELLATEILYHQFPFASEGEMTNYRSALVKRENLAMVARELNLGTYLVLSRGEEESGGREKDYLLANVFEALVGALYLSVGLEKTRDLVKEWVMKHLEPILEAEAHIDPKSRLQEMTQGDFGITPRYEVISEVGLDHDKTFEVVVYIGDILAGGGKGGSKKEAQTKAAEKALESQDNWSALLTPRENDAATAS